VNRPLHPAAWWLWALGLAVAASRTTNPLLLGLVIAVAGLVAVRCREDSPWAGSYGVFLRFGLVVIALRVTLQMLLGGITGPTVLFRLPQVPLPRWAVGIRLGGPVTAEGVVYALSEGLLLVALLACVGAANSLANPRRLLRSLPAALYEVSVAVVVALTVAPQLVASGRAVRRARLLRGDTARGWRAVRTVLVPVIEDALDRSLVLAAAMDSRGYGRTAGVSRGARRLTGALVLAGLLGMCIGVYGLLDETAPALVGGPMLTAGLALAVAGLVLGARRVSRTRYRPDRWRATELGVAASGLAAAAASLLTGALSIAALGSADLVPPVMPLGAPRLPPLPALGILLAATPALFAPHRDDRPADPVARTSPGPHPALRPVPAAANADLNPVRGPGSPARPAATSGGGLVSDRAGGGDAAACGSAPDAVAEPGPEAAPGETVGGDSAVCGPAEGAAVGLATVSVPAAGGDAAACAPTRNSVGTLGQGVVPGEAGGDGVGAGRAAPGDREERV
jgi:energy-coupling factor transport system permease protein